MRSWTIKRRYKDFDYLDRQLKKQFPSLILPTLPPKRYLRSSSDPEIVDERKQQLENYLNRLVSISQIWARNDFVLFLNDDSNLMTFIWSFERMRRLQDMLRAAQSDNQQERTQLNKDLQYAEKQVKELQEKLSQMEMLFLQQAAGMAKEQLPSSLIRSISGVHSNAHLAAQLQAELMQEEQGSFSEEKVNVGMELDEQSSGVEEVVARRRKSESSVNTSGGESVESGENSSFIEGNAEVEVEEIKPEDVIKAIHLVQQGARPTTPDDRVVTAVTLELQEALRISQELFDHSVPPDNSDAPLPSGSVIDTTDLIFGHTVNSPPPTTAEKSSPEKARDFSRFSPTKFPVSKAEEVLNSFVDTPEVDQHSQWANLLVKQMTAIEEALFPSESSLQTRFDVFVFVRDLICRTLGVPLFPIGSSVSHTFLQDSDLNCTAFVSSKSPLVDDTWYVKVNEALCLSAFQQQAGNITDSSSSPIVVSNVSFVNREMKMIRSIINGITVDITMNQHQSLFMETLIERVDAFVGRDNLFKRSLLLLKAWFQYESSKYTYGGDSLTNSNTSTGGTSGLKYVSNNTAISTWSIVVMLIATFQQHGENIFFPIQALGHCFRYLTGFDWMNCALTVFGPVPLSSVHEYKPVTPNENSYLPASIFSFPTIDDQLQINKQFYTARPSHQNTVGQQPADEEETVAVEGEVAAEPQNEPRSKETEELREPVAQSSHPAAVTPLYSSGILNVLDPLSHIVLEPITPSGSHHGNHQPKRPYANLLSTMTQSTAENFLEALHNGYKHFQSLCDSCSKVLSFGVFTSDSVRKEVGKFVKECFFNICHHVGVGEDALLVSKLDSSVPLRNSCFTINVQDLQFARSYSEIILGGRIDSELLSQLVVLILEKKGSMPVGEIGKNLQSLLGCDLLSKRLKEQFSGLKKAIEHANIKRLVVGTEHPFNPIVKLVDEDKETSSPATLIPWSCDHLNYLFTPHQVALQLQGVAAGATNGNAGSGQSVVSHNTGYSRDNRDNYSVVSGVTNASSGRGSGGYHGNPGHYNYRNPYRRPPPMVLENNSQYAYRGNKAHQHMQSHHPMYPPQRMNSNSVTAINGPPHPPNSPFYPHPLPPGAIPIPPPAHGYPLELLPPGVPPGMAVAGSPVGMYPAAFSPIFSSSPVQIPFIPPPHAFFPPGPVPGYPPQPHNAIPHPNPNSMSPNADQQHSS